MSNLGPEFVADLDDVDPLADVATVVSRAVQELELRLLRYAEAWVGNRETARDIVQETFLQLHRQSQVGLPPALTAWLFTVCRHRAIDWCRSQQRGPTRTGNDPIVTDMEQVPIERETPVEVLIRQESHQQLRDLLGGLSPSQRETMRLRFQGGLSYREIAQVTGMTVNHVGVTLHTALQQLRERIGDLSKS